MMKIAILAVTCVFLFGCQTQAIKQQSNVVDFQQVKQLKEIPKLDESMATLDMAEFARRH